MLHPRAESSTWLALQILACGLFLSLGCTSKPSPKDPSAVPIASSFAVVAEGPCSKLSVQTAGTRTFIIFGDTGYELRDWNPGEQLAASQSIVEIRDGSAFRNLALLRGLPANDGGYVSGDITLGGDFSEHAWLIRVTRRYSPRGAGALFQQSLDGYEWRKNRWARHPAPDIVQLPPPSRSLPALPVDTMCSARGPDVTFRPQTSATLPTGHVWIAGRCEDRRHINLRDPLVLVAMGAPLAQRWEVTEAPRTSHLDAILNLRLHARDPSDVHLIAYEPFRPVEKRNAYLAHFDGERWSRVESPIRTGMTSISGSPDGTLWVAAGYDLWRRATEGSWEQVSLPSLLFSRPERPQSLRIASVLAVARDDVWVEAAYRVRLSGKAENKSEEARASVLFRSKPLAQPLYCDAREAAEDGLVAVEL